MAAAGARTLQQTTEEVETKQPLVEQVGPHEDGQAHHGATRSRITLMATASLLLAATVAGGPLLFRGLAKRSDAADVGAVAEMATQISGAVNGDAVPFKNIHLATRGYNVYYADPAPPSPSDWKPHAGKYLGGHAAGDSTKRSVEASKKRCEALGSKCGGFTCTSDSKDCTVRASETLKDSPSGETSYVFEEVKSSLNGKELSMDPGLRKPVFALAYTRGELSGDRRHTQPDGYHATVDSGCSTAFTSKSIRDEYEYTKDTSNEISLTAGVEVSVGVSFPPPDEDDGGDGGGDDEGGGLEVGVGAGASLSAGASGTLSHKDQEIRNENELRDQRMERSVAKCASYVAAIEYGAFPKTHPDFQKAIDNLGGSPEKYWDLFDEYGTHFLTSVKMGARHTVRSYFRNDQYDTMTSKIKGIGVSVGVSASASAGVSVGAGAVGREIGVDAGVDASADLVSPKEKKAVDVMKTYIQKQETSSVGPPLGPEGVSHWWDAVAKDPVPIRFDKREICMHPAFDKTQQEACAQHLKGYCSGRLRARGAPCTDLSVRECYNDLECKEDHLCRNYKCKPAPICHVTLCEGPLHNCGASYTLPKVIHAKAANGRVFDLKQADWWDRVSSFKLSDGCSRIEAVDDDGQCRFGKGDNRNYGGNVNLPYDLDNDVCMVRVYAKDLPHHGQRRLLQEANSTAGTGEGVDHPQVEQETPGLSEMNALLLERRLSQQAGALAPPAADPKWLDDEPPAAARHRQAVRRATAKLRAAEARGAATAGDRSLRRLAVQKHEYIKNIGKAMYGYNHYFGAPLSAEYAGTDPGFQHRSVWHDTYKTGNVAAFKEFTAIPKGRPLEPSTPGYKQVAYNCNCGSRVSTHSSGMDSVEKCSKACLDEAKCNAFALWTNQGKSAGACALYTNACPHGSGDGHVAGNGCPAPTHHEYFNVVYNKVSAEPSALSAEPSVPYKQIAKNCNCGSRVSTHSSGMDSIEKCSKACLDEAKCNAFALWTNQGKSAGACALYTNACPAGSGDGHVAGNGCPAPTHHEYFNVVYNKVTQSRRLSENSTLFEASSEALEAGPPRMLEATTLKVPDGWKVTMGKSIYCEKSFNSKEIKSHFGYKNEMKDSFSLGGIDIGPASFDYSSESREFNERSGKEKKAMIATKAECIDFLVEMQDLENNPPPTNPSFQFVADAAHSEAEFYALFDMFGLHFPEALVFGSRYGLTRYIDEQNYKSLSEQSESTTVTAGVSHTVGVDKGCASAGVTVSAEVSNTKTESTKTREAVAKYTEEVREFSVGKRMPNKGGVAQWIKDAGEEPMPIRFSLRSMCDHPAFAKAGTKDDCFKFSDSYCTNHLQRLDSSLTCFPPAEPECMWDLDCKRARHVCNEGTCTPEPDCRVTAYKDTHLRGSSMSFGPIYRRDRPGGEVFDLGWMEDEVSSFKISSGCEEVILMDEDACREVYVDNDVITLRTNNNEVRKNSIVNDLDNDVCKVKVLAKEKWA